MKRERMSMPLYQRILVAVDNSKYSDAAVRLAATLAQAQGATVVGFHVYAAQLHEQRFLHMAPGLPERYGDVELQRQRSVHESLISKGLRLISEAYLDRARALCEELQVTYEGRLAEGKNYEEIVKEARTNEYGLVMLGALGLGARRRSIIGSVCERVLRTVTGDVMIARDSHELHGILVAIDGSPNSYQALARAVALGLALEEPVEVVTVYDPQFHIVAFQRLAGVLSEETASAFRFKEQKHLHAEVIDKGLEKLYRAYLFRAEELAALQGQKVHTTLLTGKPFQSILDYVEERHPRLLVVGRFGQHGTELSDIGSTTENLARLAPCSVLAVNGTWDHQPAADRTQDEFQLPWSAEAKSRLGAMSDFARSVVREAAERYAQQYGYSEVTVEVLLKARQEVGW